MLDIKTANTPTPTGVAIKVTATPTHPLTVVRFTALPLYGDGQTWFEIDPSGRPIRPATDKL